MPSDPSWQGERGTSTERGYGTAWQRLRKAILKRDRYMCQQCLRNGRAVALGVKPFDHAVDHITPKYSGGTDDPVNLQSLCRECHDIKSLQEATQGRGHQSKPRVQYDARGFPIW